MTDLEKVIKGLECCNSPNRHVDCPYDGAKHYNSCTHRLLSDAIAMLREQEPVLVEHKKVNDEYQAIEDEFVCTNCGAWWMIPEQDLKYCPGCGRAVKWDA